MTGLHRKPVYTHEESIARVVWAAHILYFLTNNRNHEKLHEADNNADRDGDTDELSDCGGDYDTENYDSIGSSKFRSSKIPGLYCAGAIALQGMGWGHCSGYTEGEDGVEVDIARNDGFLFDDNCFDSRTLGYCKMLEEFLASSAGGEYNF